MAAGRAGGATVAVVGAAAVSAPGVAAEAAGVTRACRHMVPAIVRFPAHASTAGLAVAPATAGHGPTAYVGENGSSLPQLSVGDDIRVVRLRRTLNGLWRGTKVGRITGFRFRDPLGLALGPDGALYVTLLGSGEVRRIPTS